MLSSGKFRRFFAVPAWGLMEMYGKKETWREASNDHEDTALSLHNGYSRTTGFSEAVLLDTQSLSLLNGDVDILNVSSPQWEETQHSMRSL